MNPYIGRALKQAGDDGSVTAPLLSPSSWSEKLAHQNSPHRVRARGEVAGEFTVFVFTNGNWSPIVEGVDWEDAQRTVGQMSSVMDCATQIRNADETIIVQEGELISTYVD